MIVRTNPLVWNLAADELVRLDSARGATLHVTHGTLWITLQHDTRDVVLRAGDAFTIDRDGLTLIEAQQDTTVWVMARGSDRVRARGHRAPLGHRLAAAMKRIVASDPLSRWVPYF